VNEFQLEFRQLSQQVFLLDQQKMCGLVCFC